MPNTTNLSLTQVQAIRCAHADLVGAYQYAVVDNAGGKHNGHDWDAHEQSIRDLESAFPDIFPEPADLCKYLFEESDENDKLMTDLLNTAFDGTFYDWGELKVVDKNEDGDIVKCRVRPDPRISGPVFDDGDPRNKWQELDIKAIGRAVRRIRADKTLCSRHIRAMLSLGVAENDACHFDADVADAVVQIALFDEIVFS